MRTIDDVELVLDAHAEVGEGPVWDADAGLLRWVDITAGTIHAFDPVTGANQSVAVGRAVGAIALREGGGLVVAAVGGFYSLADGASELDPLAPIPDPDGVLRMNDGKVDPQGRFWASTMGDGAEPSIGTLHRLEPDGTLHDTLTGLTIPNGIDWSLDGQTMYFIDSPTHRIDALDFDPGTGGISDRRTLATTEVGVLPDGMTVDEDGFLWVALWDGWAVHRYDPEGGLDAIVPLPVAQVASCTFGGPHFDELYITTAGAGLDEDAQRAQPHAGGVFRCRPGVRGRPPSRFGG